MSQPPSVVETDTLIQYLDSQRGHVLGILEGLDDQALRRPVLPSGWSCLGLVHHLALDIERFWFQAVVAGERNVIDGLGEEDNAWLVPASMSSEEVLDLYRREIGRANAILMDTSLDSSPAWWPDFFGDFRLRNVREIVLHVIVETACHAGHLDAAREMIDGRQWMVLTE